MKKIFLYLLLSITLINNAQETEENYNYQDNDEIENNYVERGLVCTRTVPHNWDDKLMLMDNYIPLNDTFPVITIKCNVHIWREDNGTGNRWLDTEEYRDSLRLIFNYANSIVSHNVQYSETIPNTIFVPDTKYRFELDSVYYYNNSYLAYKTSNSMLNQYLK